jgi:hypothetical protein
MDGAHYVKMSERAKVYQTNARSNHNPCLRGTTAMATAQLTTVDLSRSTKICRRCGERKSVDSFSRYQRACMECQDAAVSAVVEAEPRSCAHCGGSMEGKQIYAKYCSRSCKDLARIRAPELKEKKLERHKKYYDENKYKLREEAKARMRKRRATEEGKKKHNEYNVKYCRKYRAKKAKHDAHVKAYKQHLKRLKGKHDWHVKGKHDWHVKAFSNFKKTASDGWHARYWKSIRMPWKNRRLSDAVRYKIRYRLDDAFRLKEINRQTWRRDVLISRDDGTINFWALLKERNTCPYCGCQITKENAVADHMDPLCLGGDNGQHNLTICCRKCNVIKSGTPFVEWVETLPKGKQRSALAWYRRKHGRNPHDKNEGFVFEFVA